MEILNPRDLQKYDKNDMNHLVVGAFKVDGVKLLDNIVIEGFLVMFDQEYRIGHKREGFNC